MSKGISLHIGVNRVDDTHYRTTIFEADGWDGALEGCEADAIAMEALARAQGFDTNMLLTDQATRENVKNHILQAAGQLEKGDYFFLTYSGHGSQVRDRSFDERFSSDSGGETQDRLDETWCLFDKQMLDDELYKLWGGFKEGVRILIFSDSCHSGTVTRGEQDVQETANGFGLRIVPRASINATYKVHKAFYDGLQAERGKHPEISARVLLFSGCQDDELSREDQSADNPGGLFTKSIVKTWEPGKFSDYGSFFNAIKSNMPDDQQTPNFYVFGGADDGFEGSTPFKLSN